MKTVYLMFTGTEYNTVAVDVYNSLDLAMKEREARQKGNWSRYKCWIETHVVMDYAQYSDDEEVTND